MSRTPEKMFADRIRQQRRRLGLSQAEVADQLSHRLATTIDKSALARMEGGSRGIRLNEAVALAGILHTPVSDLIRAAGAGDRDAYRRAQDELDNAEVLLHAAVEDVERRGQQVQQARARLAELEHQDLGTEISQQQWPGT